jgi:hypothetical protein
MAKTQQFDDYVRPFDPTGDEGIARAGSGASTGVLGAGCKVEIGTRLKRSGLHWNVNGANCHRRSALLETQRMP